MNLLYYGLSCLNDVQVDRCTLLNPKAKFRNTKNVMLHLILYTEITCMQFTPLRLPEFEHNSSNIQIKGYKDLIVVLWS